MMTMFGSHINFLTVYILEAHANDTWPIGSDIVYNQTRTIADRCNVACDFINDNSYEFPIRIDAPPNEAFNTLFAAWPLRFYVIGPDSNMKFICEPHGDLILVTDLITFLGSHLQLAFK